MAPPSDSPTNNSANLSNNESNTVNSTSASQQNITSASSQPNLVDLPPDLRWVILQERHAQATKAARATAETNPAALTESSIDCLDQKDLCDTMKRILNNVEGRTPTQQEFTVLDLLEKAMEWMKEADFNNQAQHEADHAQYMSTIRRRQILRGTWNG